MADARMARLRRTPVDDWTDDDLRYSREYRAARREEREERREEREREARRAERDEAKQAERDAAKREDDERYGFLETAGVKLAQRSGMAPPERSGGNGWLRQAADAVSGRQLAQEREASQSFIRKAAARREPPLRPGERPLLHLAVLNGVPGAAERLAAFDNDDTEE